MTNRISADEEPERTKHHVKEVVLRYRAGDSDASTELYEMFKPLIRKETSSIYVKTHLGEDAEDIAWKIFYETVEGYKGNQFSTLPGLIQAALRCRIHNEIRDVTGHPTSALENMTEEENLQYASYCNDISNTETMIILKDAISKLPEKQQSIIKEILLQGLPFEEFSVRHDVKRKNLYNVKRRALKKLKEILTATGFVRKNNTRKPLKKGLQKKSTSNNSSK